MIDCVSIRTRIVESHLGIGAASETTPRTLLLFADNNSFSNRRIARDLLTALIPMGIRHMAQWDIGMVMDDRAPADGGPAAGGAYWDRCAYENAIYEPRGMSVEELEVGVAALHRS